MFQIFESLEEPRREGFVLCRVRDSCHLVSLRGPHGTRCRGVAAPVASGGRRRTPVRQPHICRTLVRAESKVDRVSQQPVERPLRKLHLCDERRCNPMIASAGPRERLERRVMSDEWSNLGCDAVELRLTEAGADLAGEDELTELGGPFRKVAKEQRTEMISRLTRLGPSTDDELLGLNKLQLLPARMPLARVIGGGGVFGTMPSHPRRRAVARRRIPPPVLLTIRRSDLEP